MEKKKKTNYLLIIIFLLFIFFTSLYIGGMNGYFEYGQYKKTMNTNSAIERFEEDVKENKKINEENYLDSKYKDYSNGLSKFGLKLSVNTEKIFTKGIKNVFKYLSKLVLD